MATEVYTAKNTHINPLYRAWHNMRMRCNNPNTPCYKNYGGRGIKVCDRWGRFDLFLKDMREGYLPGLQLDRTDNDGDYDRENCRWTTPKQNARNTRRNRFISYGGTTKCVAEWAESLGVKRSTFSQRYYVYGWPLERLIGGYLGNR